jgi:hypothetical protein
MWFIFIAVYIIVLALGISTLIADNLHTSYNWVKVIFWPIAVFVYFLGLLLFVIIYVPRKLFKGIRICLYEIKDFFVESYNRAIKK